MTSRLKASTVSPLSLQRSAEFLRLRALSFRESPECFLTVASHFAARAPSFLESSAGLCADVCLACFTWFTRVYVTCGTSACPAFTIVHKFCLRDSVALGLTARLSFESLQQAFWRFHANRETQAGCFAKVEKGQQLPSRSHRGNRLRG